MYLYRIHFQGHITIHELIYLAAPILKKMAICQSSMVMVKSTTKVMLQTTENGRQKKPVCVLNMPQTPNSCPFIPFMKKSKSWESLFVTRHQGPVQGRWTFK